ncbi:MAG: hypothetical protein E7563_00900 [Ruminococcaceae bacterium]|nr:hypothetical protein [Oscillospiraceae bacterium]
MKEKFKNRMNSDNEYKDMIERKKQRQERSEKFADGYTVALLVICLIVALVFFIFSAWQLGLIFLGISSLLGLMTYIDRKLDNDKQKDDKTKKGGKYEK